MRLAISLSSATARIDRPVLLRCTNSCRATIATIAVTNTSSCTRATGMPMMLDRAVEHRRARVPVRLRPEEPSERVRDEQRRADRGDERHEPRARCAGGRYAMRSSSTATSVDAATETTSRIVERDIGLRVQEAAPQVGVGEEERDERTRHEDLAVREVDHAQDAVDERVPEGDQREDRALPDAVHDLVDPEVARVTLALGQGQGLVDADDHDERDRGAEHDEDDAPPRERREAADPSVGGDRSGVGHPRQPLLLGWKPGRPRRGRPGSSSFLLSRSCPTARRRATSRRCRRLDRRPRHPRRASSGPRRCRS